MAKTLQVFKDLPQTLGQEPANPVKDPSKLETLQVGFGGKVLRVDRNGIWLGSEKFADAPFSVDMNGNIVATSLDLSGFLEIGEALSDIGAGNITGTYIANGAIVSDKIAANAITANKIQAQAIDGMTITGALIRTSSSGSRVEINDSDDSIKIYDSGGTVRAESYSNGWQFNNSAGGASGRVFIENTFGNLQVQAAAADLFLTAASEITFAPNNGSIIAYFDSTGLTMNDDIHMNGNEITGIDELTFQKRTASTNADGEMLHYDDGSAQSMRVQMDGIDYTFDLSFA